MPCRKASARLCRLRTLIGAGTPRRRVHTEFFPVYAPQLNPQDKCWGNFKYHRLANHGITQSEALAGAVGREFLCIRSEQDLLRCFVRASDLLIRM